MKNDYNRKIVLEDGSEYYGYGFGYHTDRVCEIVFNTAMVGYQEAVTDPSCTDQMVVMTYPLIGNYGITDEDFESKVPTIGGLVVREYNDLPSNFRYTKTLSEILVENKIPGIWGVDTRKISRTIRDKGSMKVYITDADTTKESALEVIKNTELPKDAVARVSCKKRWYSRTSNHKYNIIAVDCGIKLNIIRCLNARGCNVTVVPYNTPYDEIEIHRPDAIVISNGPGNPEDVPEVVELIKKLKGEYPIFGIGLGNLLIALAYGAKTRKLKFGHAGGNHPVKNLETGKIFIASQGHDYVVDEASLEGTDLKATFKDILDNTVEGVSCKADRVCGVQFHPESAPGPQDSMYIFDKFIEMMKEGKESR